MLTDNTSLASLVAAACSSVAHDHPTLISSGSTGSAREEAERMSPAMRAVKPSSTTESESLSPAPVSRSSSGAEEDVDGVGHPDDRGTPSSSTLSSKKRKDGAEIGATLTIDGASMNVSHGPMKKRVKGEGLGPSTGELRHGRHHEPAAVTSQPTGEADRDKPAKETGVSEANVSTDAVKQPGNDSNDEDEILSIVRDELSADDKKLQGQNVVGHALLKLANLCDMNDRGKRNADFFLDTIGVGSIILLMKKNPGNPKIQGCGAALLLNLMNLASNKGRVMEAIHRMGGLEVISGAIHSLPNDEKVQLYGCAVLQKWTKGGADDRKALVNAHGIEAFVAAIKKNRKDVRIQRLGCKALSTICLEKDYLPRVLQAGGFSALIAAGERFPTDPIASVSALNAARQYLMLNKAS